jgi:hypothetical protein
MGLALSGGDGRLEGGPWMHGPEEPNGLAEFDMKDGMALALSYLEDPSAVPCPYCGPDTMEVLCYVEARGMEEGTVIPTSPEGDYPFVVYSPCCSPATALDLTRDDGERREAA